MRWIALALLPAAALALLAQSQLKLQPNQQFICAPNATIKVCSGATSPTSDCTGLIHIHVFTDSGKVYEVTGTIDNLTDTTGTNWSPAP